MSQIVRYISASGPGSGTVTSISAGEGITLTPNPITTTGTVALTVPVVIADGGTNATSFSTTDGTVYFDGTKLATTATGTANFVLTSNGAGVAPSYQAVSASGAVTSVSAGANISITGTATAPIVNVAGTTNHAVQVGTGATGLTSLTVGTNGQVLLGSTAANPVFGTLTSSDNSISFTTGAGTLSLQVAGGTTTGKTITGNTGGALSPTAGNWNIVTANSTVVFAGAVSTETLDFNLTNLVLGSSLPSLTAGSHNVGLGSGVFNSLTSATDSVAIGWNAGNALSSGTNTTLCGSAAGQALTTGQLNSAFGSGALAAATSGAANAGSNVAIGYASLSQLTTGVSNVCVGTVGANALKTGTNSILIGTNVASTYAGAESSNIIIGNAGVLSESNTMRLGTSGSGTGQVNRCFVAGVDGVNVGSVAKVVTLASDQLGTATITAGAGITVTPGANTITIASIGAGVTWSVITANQTAVVENGYFANKAGTLALALPATSAIGDIIEVTNENTALGVQFTQAAGQQILIGNTNTTLGATGTLTSSAVGDTLKIVCKTANTIWRVIGMNGNWTPA